MAEAQDVPLSIALDYIQKEAEAQGVDPNTAKRVFLAENLLLDRNTGAYKTPSSVNTGTKSPKGALGLMQVMPQTFEGMVRQGYLAATDTMDTIQGQIKAGVAALRMMSKEQGTTDPDILAAAYNGGFKRGKSVAAGNIEELPLETQNYLKKTAFADTILSPSQATVRKSEPASLDPGMRAAAPASAPKDAISRSMEAINEMVEKSKAIFEDLISQTTKSTEEAQAQYEVAAGQAAAAGAKKGKAAIITGTIESANAQMRERVTDLYELNTTNPDNLISSNLALQNKLSTKMEPLGQEIKARMGVGFFDNPLEWLVNQTVLPGQVSTYNALAQTYNDSVSKVERAQSQVSAQQKIDVAGTAELLLDQGRAIADADVAVANAKAAEIRAQSSSMAAQRVLAISRLRGQMLGEQMEAAKFNVVEMERQLARGDKEKAQATIAEFDRKAAVIGAAIGKPGVTFETLKKLPAEVRQMWEDAVNQGSWGGDKFEEVMLFLKTQGNVNKMPKEIGQFVFNWQQEIDKEKEIIRQQWPTLYPGAKQPTEKELFTQAALKISNRIKTESTSGLQTGNPATNPYVLSMENTVKFWNGIPTNPVYLRVQQAIQNKERVSDAILFDVIRKEVDAGTVEAKVAAAALAEFYSQGVKRNNTARTPELLGLKTQEDYKLLPPRVKQPINMMNPTEVERVLTTSRASSLSALFGRAFTAGTARAEAELEAAGQLATQKQNAIQNVFQLPQTPK